MAGSNVGIKVVTQKATTAEKGHVVTGTVIGTGATTKYGLDTIGRSGASDFSATGWFNYAVQSTPDYSANDQIGTIVEFTNIFDQAGGRGLLTGLILTDDDKILPDLDILIFDSSPTIASSDNGALDLTLANLDKLVAKVPIRLGNWGTTLADFNVAFVPMNGVSPYGGPQFVQAASSTSLFVLMQAQATLNFATTSALRLKLSVLRL